MTRRSFFETLAVAAAGFTILPAATTYSRVWRAVKPEPETSGSTIFIDTKAGEIWWWNNGEWEKAPE